jgi:hypothetical protein
LLRHAPQLIYLWLTYLVFPPLVYFIWLGFRPARTVTYLFGVVLAGLAGLARPAGHPPLPRPTTPRTGRPSTATEGNQTWLNVKRLNVGGQIVSG